MIAKRKIIIDTDPGQDDAIAIMLALASPEFEVLGITCVAGNAPLRLTVRNAQIICEASGFPNTPIYVGEEKPTVGKLVTAEHVHGKTGLDGMKLFEPTIKPQSKHAVDYIVDTLRDNNPNTITLCPLGPLTNIAKALNKAPDIIPKIDQIVLMGGAYFEVGNVTPTAEFNIFVDPEAAEVVMKSGISITMLPLDVTHKVLLTRERIRKVGEIGNKISNEVVGMANFFERFDIEKYGSNGAPLHDPTVIAYLLEPEMFSGKFINVEIETHSKLTRGMTVADWWGVSERTPNAMFIGDVDSDRFFEVLTKRLANLP